MSKDWVACKWEKVTETYKFQAHQPQKVPYVSWMVCRNCGLIYLKNSRTIWAISKGCNNELHPDYKKVK